MFTAVAQPRLVRPQSKVTEVSLPVKTTTQKSSARRGRPFFVVLLKALSACIV